MEFMEVICISGRMGSNLKKGEFYNIKRESIWIDADDFLEIVFFFPLAMIAKIIKPIKNFIFSKSIYFPFIKR